MKNDEFEIIYSKYYTEIYVYALSLCKNHDLAQDLVSETFYKALLSVKESNEHLKYWLFRVCKNLYLDYLKKNKKLQQIDNLINCSEGAARTLLFRGRKALKRGLKED